MRSDKNNKYYAGYELDSLIFTNDPMWTSVFDIKNFSLSSIFQDLIKWIRETHKLAQIPKEIGASFHFKKCNGFLGNQEFRKNYLEAIKSCSIPLVNVKKNLDILGLY